MLALERSKSSGKCVGHLFEVTRSDISSTTVERSSEVERGLWDGGDFLILKELLSYCIYFIFLSDLSVTNPRIALQVTSFSVSMQFFSSTS